MANAASTNPIVGRNREQTRLRQLLDDAIEGNGSLVLISGEAGIGKTTLINDLIASARDLDCLVLTGGCYDLTATPPYGPWSEVIRDYAPRDDQPSIPAWFGDSDAMAQVGSQTALFDETRHFFADLATTQPLVLVLEDLHWSDPASLELLRYIGRSCAASGILIVATYRDDEISRRHPLFQMLPVLVRETGAARIELRRFTSDQIREMVAARGLADADATRLVAYLDQRTSGNPLFATELLRALESEGALRVTDEGVRLGELDEDHLPSFVLQIIERRLARLDSETRRPLEIAAIIGQEVPFDLWELVSDLDQEELDVTIEQALTTHVLEETADHRGLRFTHALIREVLYEGVIPTRRRNWHQRVADALIASPDPDPDTVAFHLERANDQRLANWLIQAGNRANQHHARLMAAERFDRAQVLLEGAPERASERAWLLFQAGHGLRHNDFDRSIQHLEESEAVALADDRPVIAHLAKAHQGLARFSRGDVRQGLDDTRAGVFALEHLSPAEQDELDQLVAQLGGGTGVQGRGTLGLLLASIGSFGEARDILQNWPESEWETSSDAYRATGMIHAAMGQPTQARQAFMRSSEINEALGDPGLAALDLLLMLHYVYVRYETEQVHERRKLIHAMQLLRARDTSVSLLEGAERYAEIPWADDYFLSGRWDRAQELLDRQLPAFGSGMLDLPRAQMARHQGDAETSWGIVHQHLPRGSATLPGEREHNALVDIQPLAIQLALDAGQIDEAHAWLEANDRLLDWSGAVLGRAENRLLWARYHQMAGDEQRAREHAERALAYATDPRQPLALIAAHRLLGEVDTNLDRYDSATNHLRASLELAKRCEAPYEQALTLLALAELATARNEPQEASGLLREARVICEDLGAQRSLKRADRIEAELRRHSTDHPAGLSNREVEVLEQAATGMTNAEIGEALYISPRTVAQHLRSVYNKLGVNSRAGAVGRWAEVTSN